MFILGLRESGLASIVKLVGPSCTDEFGLLQVQLRGAADSSVAPA